MLKHLKNVNKISSSSRCLNPLVTSTRERYWKL